MAQGTGNWQAFVKTVMNLRVSQNARNVNIPYIHTYRDRENVRNTKAAERINERERKINEETEEKNESVKNKVRQCTCNVTLRRVHVTIVAVEKQ